MLDWAIQRITPAIVVVSNEEADLAKDLLAAEEREALGHICDFPKGLHDDTMATEGRRDTLDRNLPTCTF